MSENRLFELPVVVVGKNRTRMTCAVIDHLKAHIKNAKLYFICVSDRSRPGHDKVIENHLRSIGEERFEVLRTLPEENRYGWGCAINLGLQCAFDQCLNASFALIVDNDWLLQRDLDIERFDYAFAMSEVGAVTFKSVNPGTNVSLAERKLDDGSIFLLRDRGTAPRYSFTAEIGCMLITRRFRDRYGDFKENCVTDETEWAFCDWYNSLSAKERSDSRLWFATDKELFHEELNGENHVFTHVGLVSQHEGPHKWNCPDEYKYLSDDSADEHVCKGAVLNDLLTIADAKGIAYEDMTIPWDKYFDKVYCMFYLDERKERLPRLEKELSRIGLLESSVFQWRYDVATDLDKPLKECSEWHIDNPSYKKLLYNYVRILKESLILGYKRIMILEDDVAFLKDRKEIVRILDSLPDAPIVQMDKFVWLPNQASCVQWHKDNGKDFIYADIWFSSAACNVFNTEGMKEAIAVYEDKKCHTDEIGKFLSHKIAVSTKNICVQVIYKGCHNFKGADLSAMHNCYRRQGMDEMYSEYAVPEGYDMSSMYSEDSTMQIMEAIDWRQFCDRIYCIHYIEHEERLPNLRKELSRVGILDSGIFELRTTYNNPVERKILDKNIPSCDCLIGLVLETSRILCEAKAKGYKRIMVIENDVAFLKDLNAIKEILSDIPKDKSIIRLEKFTAGNAKCQNDWREAERSPINAHYVNGDGKLIWGGACYILQNNGIDALSEALSDIPQNPDRLFAVLRGVAISKESICIQQPYRKMNKAKDVTPGQVDIDNDIFGPISNKYALFDGNCTDSDASEIVIEEQPAVHRNILCLKDLIDSIGKKDITVLEIGSMAGNSAEVFLLSGKVAHITCVDPWINIDSENPCNSYSDMTEKEMEFDRRMERFGNKVTKFKGTFREFIRNMGTTPASYDLVYIDALHDYENVKRDISDALTYIRPKIAIAGHDYNPDLIHVAGVKRAVDEAFNGDIKVFGDTSWLHMITEDTDFRCGTSPVSKHRKFISVYAIAKNEASVARRWYDCVKEADEVCVLDTGSTDETVEILRSLGAKVTVKTYDDWSFAVARNDSISLVSPEADILFTLDLDETIAPGWRNKLEDAWVKREQSGVSPTGCVYKYIWSFHPDGTEAQSFSVRKIHAKGQGKWKYRCHELLTEVDDSRAFFLDGFVVEHHQNRQTNRSKYLPLLEKDAKEMPDDDRSAYYYARELMYLGRWQESLDEFKRHLSLPSARWAAERASSMRNIASCYYQLGNKELCEMWLRKSADEDPTNREATFRLGEIAMEEKDYPAAVAAFRRCVAIEKPSPEYISIPIVWSARPWFLYAQALWWTGDWKGAEEASRKALEIEPNNLEVRSQYVDMAATRKKFNR